MHLIYTAAHSGFPEDLPLGGGARVARELSLRWQNDPDLELSVLGPGNSWREPFYQTLPIPTDLQPAGPDYGRGVPAQHALGARPLVRLNEMQYARFCRAFEKAIEEKILPHIRTSSLVLVSNDISEGPDFKKLARWGVPCLTILHVDVVDYFGKIYLKGLLPNSLYTRLFHRLERLRLRSLVPEVLRLVFEKEQHAVRYCQKLLVPSAAMKEVLVENYRHLLKEKELRAKIEIVPWGIAARNLADAETVAQETQKIRKDYSVEDGEMVATCIGRLSPEKGLDILLESLGNLERRTDTPLRVFLCGEPAFMRGAAYSHRLRKLAGKLKKIRVDFPGHLTEVQKTAFLQLSDFFISPSWHESFGLTILEAMQARCPILSCAHYGAQALLKPGYAILVTYPSRRGAPQVLTEGLQRMLQLTQTQRKQMGDHAFEASQDYRWEKAARQIKAQAVACLKS
ncbi:MAG: glycosyltransferase family 4 protein [Elusimicrobia bacterium]|nr:glycosyltransferase family 4 protein [Elusimicrobiota bacterium]